METFATSYKVIEASPRGLVHSVPPTGIGYLSAYKNILFIGNTDRNLQIAIPDFESERLQNIALFYDTSEPLRDGRAFLDLDFHGILFDQSGAFYAVNHLGLVRRFSSLEESVGVDRKLQVDSSGNQTQRTSFVLENEKACQEQVVHLQPQNYFRWIPDAERTYLVNKWLVSSSSGNFKIDTPIKKGIFISANLDEFLHECDTASGSEVTQDIIELPSTCYFEEFGFITALCVDWQKGYMIFGAGPVVGLCSLIESASTLAPGPIRWLQTLPFCCKSLACSDGEVTVCGYSPTRKNEDHYTDLVGGGIARLSIKDGSVLLQATFEMSPAWGNGANPVLYIGDRNEIYSVDRFGSLYLIHPNSLKQQCVHRADRAQESEPLGAAHLVFSRGVIFCGYNRGGYKLHCWAL